MPEHKKPQALSMERNSQINLKSSNSKLVHYDIPQNFDNPKLHTDKLNWSELVCSNFLLKSKSKKKLLNFFKAKGILEGELCVKNIINSLLDFKALKEFYFNIEEKQLLELIRKITNTTSRDLINEIIFKLKSKRSPSQFESKALLNLENYYSNLI
jgi:hypothetical protein